MQLKKHYKRRNQKKSDSSSLVALVCSPSELSELGGELGDMAALSVSAGFPTHVAGAARKIRAGTTSLRLHVANRSSGFGCTRRLTTAWAAVCRSYIIVSPLKVCGEEKKETEKFAFKRRLKPY